jgi:glycerophosphoryl diester phosphodiesterase
MGVSLVFLYFYFENKYPMRLTLLFLIIFCTTMPAQKIDIQGHRGCRGLMPENSLEGFIEALKQGVSTLELDLCISADGQVVVSHEPYMSSLYCSHPNGQAVSKEEEKDLNLYKMSYAKIKKFDTGSRGNGRFASQQKIKTYKPLLSEVFKKIEQYLKTNKIAAVNYNIEIKSAPEDYGIYQPAVGQFSNLVYKVIQDHKLSQRVNIQSFDFAVLKYWKQQTLAKKYVKIPLAALVEEPNQMNVVQLLGFTPEIFSPNYQLIDAAMVKKYQKDGMKVIPWTVNEPADLLQIYQMGVDGIITDYPNRWQAIRAKL